MLLDMDMPGKGGLEACRSIRSRWDLAIIVVSVRNLESDKISALDAGADDYIIKPFGTQELLARIRAALRRSPRASEAAMPPLQLGNLEVNFATRRVVGADGEWHLTRKEFDLLQFLVSNPNTPIPHRRLLQAVWGPDCVNELVYLRAFINQLRKKIEPDPAKPRYLLTERCVGYLFRPPTKN